MPVVTIDSVAADLLMIAANAQVARFSKDGSRRKDESLDLMNRLLHRVPVGRRTPEWREACEYIERDTERFELAQR